MFDEAPYLKAMLFWQKNATEAVNKALADERLGGRSMIVSDEQRQYGFAIANVDCLEKAMKIMREQWYRDNRHQQ